MELVVDALREILTPEGGWSAELLVRILLSTVILFGYVVLLARLFGSRTFATFTSYDFLTNIAAGSLVASAILGKTMIEASLSLLVLVLLQYLVSALSARWPQVQKVVDNPPIVLVEHGQKQQAAMQKARVSEASLQQNLREAGVQDLSEVKFAILESGGNISVVK